MGANGGVEGVNGNVRGVNGGAGGVPDFSTIISQQLQNLLPFILAQVGNQGNVGNQNGNVVNENVQENVGNVLVNSNRVGCSCKQFLACNPKEYDGKGGVVVLTRCIEKMEFVQDMSGCSINQKVKYTAGSFVGKALTWWNSQIRTLIREVAVDPWDGGSNRANNESKCCTGSCGQLVEIDKVIKVCKLEIEGHVFYIDLIPFGHGSFDVIIGEMTLEDELRYTKSYVPIISNENYIPDILKPIIRNLECRSIHEGHPLSMSSFSKSPCDYSRKYQRAILEPWRQSHNLPSSPPSPPPNKTPPTSPVTTNSLSSPSPPRNLTQNQIGHELLHLSNLLEINLQQAIEATNPSPHTSPLIPWSGTKNWQVLPYTLGPSELEELSGQLRTPDKGLRACRTLRLVLELAQEEKKLYGKCKSHKKRLKRKKKPDTGMDRVYMRGNAF
ncbi:hypothetical protein Tco_0415333 [Tanacetum coccineum]